MMELAPPLLLALVLGSVHALEADHIVAVSAFVVRRPTPWNALGFGTRWALGHAAVILVVGSVLVLLRAGLPGAASLVFEQGAGAALVALGLWTAFGSRSLRARQHVHDDGTIHAHLHRRAEHEHEHAVTMVGALHGLAGTAPAVALVPLAGIDSPLVGAVYLLLFGVGTAVGMGLYAMIAGWVAGRAALRSERLARLVALATGLATTAVGIAWIVA